MCDSYQGYICFEAILSRKKVQQYSQSKKSETLDFENHTIYWNCEDLQDKKTPRWKPTLE